MRELALIQLPTGTPFASAGSPSLLSSLPMSMETLSAVRRSRLPATQSHGRYAQSDQRQPCRTACSPRNAGPIFRPLPASCPLTSDTCSACRRRKLCPIPVRCPFASDPALPECRRFRQGTVAMRRQDLPISRSSRASPRFSLPIARSGVQKVETLCMVSQAVLPIG